MKAIEVENLGVHLAGRWVLREISLTLAPGAVLAIAGPNGSGKSTLLRCMAGLRRPDEGQVKLADKPVSRMRRTEIAKAIAYVPQDSRLDFAFTVRETVLMGRYAHRGRFEKETREDLKIVEAALHRTDVAHLADRPVTQLSGGERQRVLIARSLAACAGILLLDEPTANLDVEHSLDVLDLCRSLALEGRTLAIATHDLNAILRLASEAALIDAGRVLPVAAPEAVLTPANLERVFRVSADTVAVPGGARHLVFRSRRDP